MKRARFLEEAEAEFLEEVQFYADVQVKGAARFRQDKVTIHNAFPDRGFKP